MISSASHGVCVTWIRLAPGAGRTSIEELGLRTQRLRRRRRSCGDLAAWTCWWKNWPALGNRMEHERVANPPSATYANHPESLRPEHRLARTDSYQRSTTPPNAGCRSNLAIGGVHRQRCRNRGLSFLDLIQEGTQA